MWVQTAAPAHLAIVVKRVGNRAGFLLKQRRVEQQIDHTPALHPARVEAISLCLCQEGTPGTSSDDLDAVLSTVEPVGRQHEDESAAAVAEALLVQIVSIAVGQTLRYALAVYDETQQHALRWRRGMERPSPDFAVHHLIEVPYRVASWRWRASKKLSEETRELSHWPIAS